MLHVWSTEDKKWVAESIVSAEKGEMSSNVTAFRNPDGQTVAVIMNPLEFEKTVTVQGENIRLMPGSFNTIII